MSHLILQNTTTGSTVGSSTQIPVITWDNKGRVINVTTAVVAGGAGSSGITSINNQVQSFQTIVTGSTGVDTNIISTGGVHTINIPTIAAGVARGLLSSFDYNRFNSYSSSTSGPSTGSGLTVFNTAPSLVNPDVTTQTRSNNTTKAASTAFVKFRDIYDINVKDFGAVGDGVTNDAPAINAAISAATSGQTVYLPAGNYLLGSSIALNKPITLLGAETNITVNTNIAAIVITANAVTIEKIWINGSGKASGLSSQNGIISNGYCYLVFNSVRCFNLGGAGLNIQNTNVGGLRQGARANFCYFNSNQIGYLAQASAEYITFTNCYFQYNTTGVIIRAGNNSFNGGSISDNSSTGVKLEGGALNVAYINDGHGIFSGVLINHNKTGSVGNNLSIDGITLGYTFSGCHFYDAGIYIKNSVGITFSACHLAPIALFFEGSKGTMFVNNTLYRAYGFTVNNNVNNAQSQTNWINNKSYDGVAGSYLENIYGGYFNAIVPTSTTISTGTTNMDFTSISQSTGNNSIQTAYTFYNQTNKTIKNFGLGDNKVKINFNVNISLNPLADFSKLLLTLDQYDSDGTTFIGTMAIVPYVVYNQLDTANRILIFTLQGVFPLEPNRHFRVGIINNTGFSAAVVASVLNGGTSNNFNRITCEGL